MPTQNEPGCYRLAEETSCLWVQSRGGGNGQEKGDAYIYVSPFIKRSHKLPRIQMW